jgi:2-dehydropantoate 2-reductase
VRDNEPTAFRRKKRLAPLVLGVDDGHQSVALEQMRFHHRHAALGQESSARARTAEFVERCRRADFGAQMTGDVRTVLWNKMIGLSTNAALTTAARLPAGPLYADPDVLAVAAALIGEATAVARALGIAVADNIENAALSGSSAKLE